MRTDAIMCALLLVGTMATAEARAPSAREVARQHYRQGLAQYLLNHFDEAIREFEAGFAADAQPAFLYNLAQTHAKLGHTRVAIDFYRKYLELGPAEDAAELRETIARLERSLEAPRPELLTPSALPRPIAPPEPASPATASAPVLAAARTTMEPRATSEPASSLGSTTEPAPPPAPAEPRPRLTTIVHAAPPPAIVAAPVAIARAHRKRRWPIAVGVIGAVAGAGLVVGLSVGLTRGTEPSLSWSAR